MARQMTIEAKVETQGAESMANGASRSAAKTAQTPSSDRPQWFTNLLKYFLRTPLSKIERMIG
jgi:hypothetical protein